ncbi:MAG: selenide, water dikinase SelD [Chloroflexota bacterium]
MAQKEARRPEAAAGYEGARPGDVLVLTKRLGTGIITTGIDRRLVSEATVERITAQMATLNPAAAKAMQAVGAHACTDVTGFGLLGHLHELALASGVAAKVDLERVPVVDEVWDLVSLGAVPEGTRNNYRYLSERVDWVGVSPDDQIALTDAQTSGGLLIAVAPEDADRLIGLLATEPFPAMAIGRIVQGTAGRIAVRHR